MRYLYITYVIVYNTFYSCYETPRSARYVMLLRGLLKYYWSSRHTLKYRSLLHSLLHLCALLNDIVLQQLIPQQESEYIVDHMITCDPV